MNGHEQLIIDLKDLLKQAEAFTFHDFKSDIGAPKIELDRQLQILIKNNRNGRYDD